MSIEISNIIEYYLEELYDIQFDVNSSPLYSDAWFEIKPHNSDNELFAVTVKIVNDIRLVVEVMPEKYAAFSIQDMASAPKERKALFCEYANQLINRKARIEFYLNDGLYDPTEPDSWPENWNNYKLRVTKSPVCAEDESLNVAEVASEWAGIVTGMVLSLLNVITTGTEAHLEGGVKRVETNRYERDPVNRELCLTANGYVCKVCGFDFEKVYGDIGHHFIHVHHIVPVSKMDEAYVIDPVKDLIPVCPNCHAMLHRQDPPLLPSELIQLLEKHKGSSNENTREDVDYDI